MFLRWFTNLLYSGARVLNICNEANNFERPAYTIFPALGLFWIRGLAFVMDSAGIRNAEESD